MNKPEFIYKAPKVRTGDLRTPVLFFEYKPYDSPEPGEELKRRLHECFAEIYSPSIKDLDVLHATGIKKGVTLTIRDTKGEFDPDSRNFVEILDYRYKKIIWNIIDVRPDFTDNRFVTVLLGVVE